MNVLVSLAALLFLGVAGNRAMEGDSAPWSRLRLQAVGDDYGYCSSDFLVASWGERAGRASRVCRCESSGDPRAVSPDGLYQGLFQVDAGLHGLDLRLLYDPVFNSAFAAALQDRDGWRPWPVCGFLPDPAARDLP